MACRSSPLAIDKNSQETSIMSNQKTRRERLLGNSPPIQVTPQILLPRCPSFEAIRDDPSPPPLASGGWELSLLRNKPDMATGCLEYSQGEWTLPAVAQVWSASKKSQCGGVRQEITIKWRRVTTGKDQCSLQVTPVSFMRLLSCSVTSPHRPLHQDAICHDVTWMKHGQGRSHPASIVLFGFAASKW